jgi:LytR cell envelope-related transcriptional attenuator
MKPDARRAAGKAAAAVLPRRRVVVRVLNGNGRTGAAATAASRVRSRGYRIGFVGNASSHDFSQSLVMFKTGYAEEARRLARDFRVKRVGPLDGVRPAELGNAHVVFILGA